VRSTGSYIAKIYRCVQRIAVIDVSSTAPTITSVEVSIYVLVRLGGARQHLRNQSWLSRSCGVAEPGGIYQQVIYLRLFYHDL